MKGCPIVEHKKIIPLTGKLFCYFGHKWKTQLETEKVKVDYCYSCNGLRIENVKEKDEKSKNIEYNNKGVDNYNDREKEDDEESIKRTFI